MSVAKKILSALRAGPATTGELQPLLQERSAIISNSMRYLIQQNLVERTDSARGRGFRATYRRVR